MADFVPAKHDANEYNNGVQYVSENLSLGIEGDMIQADTINNLVESALYSQQQADNAKGLVDSVVTSAYAPPLVGMHYIQFNGEPTPAQIWAGTTWEIDTDYQGRTIIGSGGDYTFGATGGVPTHNHGAGTLNADLAFSTAANQIHFNIYERETGWVASYNREVPLEAVENTAEWGEGISLSGSTASAFNMSPYIVVNYWKRTS